MRSRKQEAPKRLRPAEPAPEVATELARYERFADFMVKVRRIWDEVRDPGPKLLARLGQPHGEGRLTAQDVAAYILGWRVTYFADVQHPDLVPLINGALEIVDSAFEIRVSNIAGAGWGLFARRPVGTSTFISSYGGYYLSENIYALRGQEGHYLIQTQDGGFLDATSCFKLGQLARWMNHGRPARAILVAAVGTQEGEPIANAQEVPTGIGAWTVQEIAADGELLVDYGPEYDPLVVMGVECTFCGDPPTGACGRGCGKAQYCSQRCANADYGRHRETECKK